MADEKDVVRADLNELSHDQTIARMKDLGDEIRRFAEKDDLSASDERYLEKLNDEFDRIDAHRKKLERQALLSKVDVVTRNPLNVSRGDNPKSRELETDPFGEIDSSEEVRSFQNPWDLSEVRTWNRSREQVGQELRARAYDAIERMHGTNDQTRATMTNIIEEFDTPNGKLASQLLATSSPAYMRAFSKMAVGRQSSLSEVERQALERAMALADTSGGFLIPFQLDPTVIISSNGSVNPIRQISRKVVATGDTWNGVSSAAVSWSWDSEATEVSDDSTTFSQPSITIYTARGFVPISIEAMQDEANVAGEVARLLAFGKDTLENTAFTTGSGSQPQGILTALTGGSSVVSATTAATFGLPDVYLLDEQLPARFRANASWLAHRQIYNDIRQFDTAGGAGLWERLGNDVPPLLLGRPAYEASDMDTSISTGTVDHLLLFGDFSNYVIADRIGTSVEFIPHLFGVTTGRPLGQRGWYAYYRVGADSVLDGAFRVLNV